MEPFPSDTVLATLLAGRLAGVWSLDQGRGTIAISPHLREHLGLADTVWPTQPSIEILVEAVHRDDRERLMAEVEAAIARRDILNVSFRLETPLLGPRRFRAIARWFPNGAAAGAGNLSGILLHGADEDAGEVADTAVVDHLLKARHAAQAAEAPLLARLIDAVLLEAGRNLARRLGALPEIDRFQ